MIFIRSYISFSHIRDFIGLSLEIDPPRHRAGDGLPIQRIPSFNLAQSSGDVTSPVEKQNSKERRLFSIRGWLLEVLLCIVQKASYRILTQLSSACTSYAYAFVCGSEQDEGFFFFPLSFSLYFLQARVGCQAYLQSSALGS